MDSGATASSSAEATADHATLDDLRARLEHAHLAAAAEELMAAVSERHGPVAVAEVVVRQVCDLVGAVRARLTIPATGKIERIDVSAGAASGRTGATQSGDVEVLHLSVDGEGGELELLLPGGGARGTSPSAMLRSYVVLAGFALGVARHQTEQDAVARLRERDRIATQLHDTVLQDVYAAGLRLAGIDLIADPLVAGRVGEVLEAIDRSIRDLRAAVYELYLVDSSSMVDDLAAVVRSSSAGLGFEPDLVASVPDDDPLDAHLLVVVFAVVQEALSNVARHAGATWASVRLDVTSEEVTVEVLDDGVGVTPGRRRGLGSSTMAHRAEDLGGSCRIDNRPAGGTCCVWSVPRRRPADDRR